MYLFIYLLIYFLQNIAMIIINNTNQYNKLNEIVICNIL